MRREEIVEFRLLRVVNKPGRAKETREKERETPIDASRRRDAQRPSPELSPPLGAESDRNPACTRAFARWPSGAHHLKRLHRARGIQN